MDPAMRQNFAYAFAETHNLNLEVRLKLSHLPLGNLPDLFGTWVVETQITFIGPKEVLHGKILTRKELYRGQVFAKYTLLLRGPFTPAPGNKVVFGFDEDKSFLTITREQP